jgi:hypothetical protein
MTTIDEKKNVYFFPSPPADHQIIGARLRDFVHQLVHEDFKAVDIEDTLFCAYAEFLCKRYLPDNATYHEEARHVMRTLAGMCVERYDAEILEDGRVALPYAEDAHSR